MIRSKYQKDVSMRLIKVAQAKFSKDYILMVVPKFIAKSFHSYCSMKEDLHLINRQLDQLEYGKHIKEVSSALLYSVITLYGKCYTDAKSGKAPKLEAKRFITDEEHIATHEFLMNLRHNFLAHRGETDSEIETAFYLIPKGESTTSRVEFMRVKQTGLRKKKIDEIRTLIEFIKQHLSVKIQKTGEKVNKAMLNLDPEILKLTVANNVK